VPFLKFAVFPFHLMAMDTLLRFGVGQIYQPQAADTEQVVEMV
jgi:hypothetical protein